MTERGIGGIVKKKKKKKRKYHSYPLKIRRSCGEPYHQDTEETRHREEEGYWLFCMQIYKHMFGLWLGEYWCLYLSL